MKLTEATILVWCRLRRVPDRAILGRVRARTVRQPPPFPRFATLAEVEARIDHDVHYSRFAVLSPQWEQHPLAFDEIHANDGQHFFSVSLRIGGPAMHVLVEELP